MWMTKIVFELFCHIPLTGPPSTQCLSRHLPARVRPYEKDVVCLCQCLVDCRGFRRTDWLKHKLVL